MYYVYENDKLSKYERFFRTFFYQVWLENNRIQVVSIPRLKLFEKENGHKLAKRKDVIKRNQLIQKIAQKTVKILNKTKSNKIIVSKELLNEKLFINYLYSQNLDIVNGKFLFKLLVPEILSYLIKKTNISEEDLKIAILANDVNEIVLGNIKLLIHKYKNITIVTRHAMKLKNFQESLYDKEGIVIAITNNKRNALNKANIIFNFDFPEELLNKYTIFEYANIINLDNNVKINKKRFNGVNINDYEIELNNNNLLDLVNYNEIILEKNFIKNLYEAKLYKRQSFELLRNTIQKDNVKIRYLIGENTRF